MKTNTLKFLIRLSRHTLLLLVFYFLNVSLTYGNEGPYVYSVISTGAALAISAGVQALSTGANAFAQGKLNRKNRQWQEKMYAQQRSDALSDWQMQNAYNSPEQQMERLKAAGLNPNLVYGDGNVQGNNAQDVRSSNVGSPQTAAPNFSGIGEGIQSGMMAYVDMKAKTAQTDNIRAQNEQIKEQIRSQQMDNLAKAMTYLSEAQARNATNDSITKYASKEAAQKIYNLMATGDVLDATSKDHETSALLKGTQFESEKQRRQNMVDDNTRNWIMNAQNVRESKSRIVSMLYTNARSESERRMIEESIKSKAFQNWFDSKDKDFLENISTGSKAGDAGLKWLLDGVKSFLKK